MSQWNIITYDVWGNANDGYEVNDSYGAGSIQLEGEEHFDDDVIIGKLVDAGIFDEDITIQDLCFDGDENAIYITDAVDGKPICCIQRDSRW